jgi:hypothetical protein
MIPSAGVGCKPWLGRSLAPGGSAASLATPPSRSDFATASSTRGRGSQEPLVTGDKLQRSDTLGIASFIPLLGRTFIRFHAVGRLKNYTYCHTMTSLPSGSCSMTKRPFATT